MQVLQVSILTSKYDQCCLFQITFFSSVLASDTRAEILHSNIYIIAYC